MLRADEPRQHLVDADRGLSVHAEHRDLDDLGRVLAVTFDIDNGEDPIPFGQSRFRPGPLGQVHAENRERMAHHR